MPNNQDLLTEEQLEQLEGQLTPVDVEAPIPGKSAPSVPFLGGSGSTAPFFSGSIPPQFQLDSAFSAARVLSDRVPKNALMPFGIQSNPSTNAAIQSTARTVVQNTVTPATPDDDTIRVNLQTGTEYTVQQSDINKLISITNGAGGNIYLPPVVGTTTVAVTNQVSSPFNSGNTVVVGSIATSTYVFTAAKDIAAGDFMFLAVRNVSSHSDVPSPLQMSDTANGTWAGESFAIDDPALGAATASLFWIRNKSLITAGSSITLTFKVTFPGTAFNPDVNQLWTMTGIKTAGTANDNTTLSSGTTFSSGGFSIAASTVLVSVIVGITGSVSPLAPAATQGLSWNTLPAANSSAAFNWLSGVSGGLVNDVYTVGAGHGLVDILQAFNQATPADITQLTTDFFCFVENKGAGSFNLISAAPIDGSNSPVTLGTGQGCLLVWDAPTASWYTMRGIGGGVDVDFYQTVQQAGTSRPQESKLNFLGPITAVDNGGNGSTDITVPDMVGDSGAGGTHGLVPAPGSGDAAAGKFLKASGSFVTPPTMVGDSGAGGTAGYAPAPGAGDNAAGKFLSAGGTYVNPGSNPASFNTGLVYAIAAGYALG